MAKNDVTKLADIEVTVLTALEAAFNNLYNVSEACDYAGISRKTYYKYLKRVDGFEDRMELAKRLPFRKLKEVVVKAATEGDGDPHLALGILKVRDPDFKNKVAVEVDPDAQALEDKIKDFLDDGNNRPDNLHDDSETPPSENTKEA